MTITITVVYSPETRVVREVNLCVAVDCTVGQSLKICGLLEGLSQDVLDALQVGVWGRKAALNQTLRANDRVELCRPLTVDPKVARRERFVRQGAKSAGLFAKRREGAKAGY
jgi:putative ubiquitin-RnfH superfamily antitoxin RatB of RatAB toxin-antitoxin module